MHLRLTCKLHTQERKVAKSGCGTVDKAIASGPRGPGFESSHQEILLLFNWWTGIKEKEAGNGLF